jgi:ribosomal protein L37E
MKSPGHDVAVAPSELMCLRCTRPSQDQASQHCSMDGGGAPKLRSHWQLMATGAGELVFCKRAWLLVGFSESGEQIPMCMRTQQH